jgi:hypothetical protein
MSAARPGFHHDRSLVCCDKGDVERLMNGRLSAGSQQCPQLFETRQAGLEI